MTHCTMNGLFTMELHLTPYLMSSMDEHGQLCGTFVTDHARKTIIGSLVHFLIFHHIPLLFIKFGKVNFVVFIIFF